MPKFGVRVNVVRVYSIVVEAPDEDIADSAGWNLDTLSLHQNGQLLDAEIEYVGVEQVEDDSVADVVVTEYVKYGEVVHCTAK